MVLWILTSSVIDHEHETNERAVLSIGQFSTVQIIDDTSEDEIILRIVVGLEDHPNAVGSHWISAGVTYGPTRLWVGQVEVSGIASPSADVIVDGVSLIFCIVF